MRSVVLKVDPYSRARDLIGQVPRQPSEIVVLQGIVLKLLEKPARIRWGMTIIPTEFGVGPRT